MYRKLAIIIVVITAFTSCKKENEDISLISVAGYYPLQIGNFIEYDLDSTVFEDFGRSKVIKNMEAREVIQDTIRDGEGNLSYRIDRYIRADASEQWQASISYIVTPKGSNIEVLENNLRYIKLVFPVREGMHWEGNKYIDTKNTDQNLIYMDGWNYKYDSAGISLTINGLTFGNTLRVAQRDETIGQDPSDPATPYAERTIAYEKYAKGVGLIEREFLHWEYQGANSTRTAYYIGFGIKMVAKRFGRAD